MPLDTAYPMWDARDDFARARRRQALSALRRRLNGRSASHDRLLPFDEVVAALGRRGVRDLGVEQIELGSVVGSVDRQTGFDRLFRPTSYVVEQRFTRIAAALRRGEAVPPIEVFRVGDVHFVQDGHHRVSAARALEWTHIAAHVTEVLTAVGAGGELRLADLPRRAQERMFAERVPLPRTMRARIELRSPQDYGRLAEHVEAWAFRFAQLRGTLLDRAQAAETWFAEEYEPAVDLLRGTGLLTGGTETEAYLRLSNERYHRMHTHSWDHTVVARLRDR